MDTLFSCLYSLDHSLDHLNVQIFYGLGSDSLKSFPQESLEKDVIGMSYLGIPSDIWNYIINAFM